MPNPLRRFDLTQEQINGVITAFYARVRIEPTLGPVFNTHIEADEWPAHEAKIAGFWQNAILRDKTYDGNPMAVHRATPGIEPEHFAIWLALFDTVLTEKLPAQTAAAWSELAHRIGRGLRLGIEGDRTPPDAPPKLF
ncbi:group III truncated hemoglobin [Cochlodiniinecator piscidefendens]|uniref:group III truncated hemoglobin n=1 Tax=Cochlodiniinecator piscidefendens TaxID=2715756 RepID=UPI00140E6613|nr:group III truncated hemoglobin [Cochlodiniinecator piscidefendens]